MSGYAEKDVVAAETATNVQVPEKITTDLRNEKLSPDNADQSPSSTSSAQRSPRASVDKVETTAPSDEDDVSDEEKKKKNAGLGYYFVRIETMRHHRIQQQSESNV
jgi:hypothetical protein